MSHSRHEPMHYTLYNNTAVLIRYGITGALKTARHGGTLSSGRELLSNRHWHCTNAALPYAMPACIGAFFCNRWHRGNRRFHLCPNNIKKELVWEIVVQQGPTRSTIQSDRVFRTLSKIVSVVWQILVDIPAELSKCRLDGWAVVSPKCAAVGEMFGRWPESMPAPPSTAWVRSFPTAFEVSIPRRDEPHTLGNTACICRCAKVRDNLYKSIYPYLVKW